MMTKNCHSRVGYTRDMASEYAYPLATVVYNKEI